MTPDAPPIREPPGFGIVFSIRLEKVSGKTASGSFEADVACRITPFPLPGADIDGRTPKTSDLGE